MRIDIDYLTLPEPEAVILLRSEVRRLRAAITALAAEDATLSICNGNVTVTMDATLTDEERSAVAHFAREFKGKNAATLRSLLERLGDTPAAHATPSGCREQDRCALTDAEPAAYIVYVDGIGSIMPLCRDMVEVDGLRSRFGDRVHEVVPLYRSPTLADEEREAVEEAIRRLWGFDIAATLRGLLERL